MHTNTLIIGSGPSGCSAALYTARAGLSTTLMMGSQPGGQLTLTDKIENYPGHLPVSGNDLIEEFHKQITEMGVKMIYEAITSVDLSHRPFSCKTDMGIDWTTDALIIASGASNKWLQLPNEDQFKGKGISICATCDGFFYRNKNVAIIGGGNSAIYEALFLSNIAQHVTLIYRQENITGEYTLLNQVKSKSNVSFCPNNIVTGFIGTQRLQAIQLQNIKTKDTTTLSIDGVFEAIGHIPNSDIFKGQLETDDKGFIVTDKLTGQTSVPGVFACGDIQEPMNRQAIVAAGSGCIAALNAEKFLAQNPSH